jgi:hypothetical protein
MTYRPAIHPTKHLRDQARVERAGKRAERADVRRADKEARIASGQRGAPLEPFNEHGQFRSSWPDAPADVAGVARTISRRVPARFLPS